MVILILWLLVMFLDSVLVLWWFDDLFRVIDVNEVSIILVFVDFVVSVLVVFENRFSVLDLCLLMSSVYLVMLCIGVLVSMCLVSFGYCEWCWMLVFRW